MRLYLVQHGDAVPERLDPDRPLSPAGRRGVEAVARLLVSASARVAHVIHSGKLRAQQTTELLATALAPGTVPQCARRSERSPTEPDHWAAQTGYRIMAGEEQGEIVACSSGPAR